MIQPVSRQLILVRHAKSSWRDPMLSDRERPLNGRGKRDAPRMGGFIHRQKWCPQRWLCSPAKRARSTARKLLKANNGDPSALELLEDLYTFDGDDLLRCIQGLPESDHSVLMVAHNPACEEVLQRLLGEYWRFPTCALAVLHFHGGWGQIEQLPVHLHCLQLPRNLLAGDFKSITPDIQ